MSSNSNARLLTVNHWSRIEDGLRSFVSRKTRDASIADDIVQEVYVRAHDRLSQLTDASKLEPWLYRIATNLVFDHFRSKARESRVTPPDASSEDNTLTECAAHCVAETLNDLPEKYREALQLAEMEDLAQVDLAGKLGISYSGAKSRVQRGREMLRELVDARCMIRTDGFGNVTVCKSRPATDGCSKE